MNRQYRKSLELLYGPTSSNLYQSPIPSKKPRIKSLMPSEDQEQIAFIKWCATIPELTMIFHIPNGGARDIREGGKFKMMGVRRGVPDLFLPLPKRGFYGLWIEMKRKKGGSLSPEQHAWLERLNELGYKAVVCHGCEEAILMVRQYLSV